MDKEQAAEDRLHMVWPMSGSKYWNRNVVIRVSVVSQKIEIRLDKTTRHTQRSSLLQARQAVSVRNEPRNDLVSVRGREERPIGRRSRNQRKGVAHR